MYLYVKEYYAQRTMFGSILRPPRTVVLPRPVIAPGWCLDRGFNQSQTENSQQYELRRFDVTVERYHELDGAECRDYRGTLIRKAGLPYVARYLSGCLVRYSILS